MDIQVILMQMIQLFLVIALGYFLFKMKLFDVDLNKKLTSILLTVTTPAMIVSSVLSTTVTQGLSDIFFVFILGFAIYFIMPILGFFKYWFYGISSYESDIWL